MCQIQERVPCESDEDFLCWGEFLFQNSLGGMSATMMGVAEPGTRRNQIIHFGIAYSPKWPPLPFLLSTVMSLHPQTLSLTGIISKLFKTGASAICSSLSEKVALIARRSFFLRVLATKVRLKCKDFNEAFFFFLVHGRFRL